MSEKSAYSPLLGVSVLTPLLAVQFRPQVEQAKQEKIEICLENQTFLKNFGLKFPFNFIDNYEQK